MREARLRAFAALLARSLGIRGDRRGTGDIPSGAAASRAHAPRDRAQVALSVLACRNDPGLAGAGGARVSARFDRAYDTAALCLFARMAAIRSRDVGQPPGDA